MMKNKKMKVKVREFKILNILMKRLKEVKIYGNKILIMNNIEYDRIIEDQTIY